MEYSERFENVWSLRWSTKGKAAAYRAWEKLDPEDKELIEEVIAVHRVELAKRPLEFRPHMSTWINKRHFEDEFDDPCADLHVQGQQQQERGWVDNYGWATN